MFLSRTNGYLVLKLDSKKHFAEFKPYAELLYCSMSNTDMERVERKKKIQ